MKRIKLNVTVEATKLLYLDIELKSLVYNVEVGLTAVLTDESFDHEFGTQEEWGQEITDIEVLSCLDENDKDVKDETILKEITSIVNDTDFDDEEFDFSDV
tara:strand:+ start:231 stop:533 length:303 start_codon:yes stop_codon:yes gene_type:complete